VVSLAGCAHIQDGSKKSILIFKMSRQILGILFIAAGILYLIKPNLFRVGIWKKTAVTQQMFKARQYEIYMRILGGILIILGIINILR
jgi:hypothetical protein